ncbi:MAG: 5-formyltetrahydrofolate cyclo-ligase [Sedimentisphaerales bacterium]|nr:5-formyltetrahydrofolate cyclo-ligase [Sedimentisphaerales bacterium]
MKERLRKEIFTRLAEMPAERLAAASAAICSKAIGLAEYQAAGVVMLYLSIEKEVDTDAIAADALAGGKVVLAPKADWDRQEIAPIQIQSLTEGLAVGRAGIREPAGGKPWPVERIDLVIAPGLAFNSTGGRLGRGGGFYDRFLATLVGRTIICSLAFDCQVVDELPAEQHDHPIDILVTEKRLMRFERPKCK